MDIWNEKYHTFNVRLAKLTGLYQMLDPGTVRLGGANVYQAVTGSLALYVMCVVSPMLFVSGWYNWTDNMAISILYYQMTKSGAYSGYKMWTVIRHSDEIRNCLSVTRYGFTSYALPNRRRMLDGWRHRSVRHTYAFAGMYCATIGGFLVAVLAFSDAETPLAHRDGSIGGYRKNFFNLYILVSADTYNTHYGTFYILEAAVLVSMGLFVALFDIILVTLCYAICGQLQIVCTAFESIGHGRVGARSPVGGDNTNEKKYISHPDDLMYDAIKTIIMDQQAVIKKFDEFLIIFKKVMLVQIVVMSSSLIGLLFGVIMYLYNQDLASKALTIEMMLPIPVITIQIFVTCYLFDKLHNQMDSLIFALYSSNWTEMNMKCRKLILLTMMINNANQKKLKYTTIQIVNLEMFYKTISYCYSILSVLVNYLRTKNN